MSKRIITGLILGAVILLCIYAGNRYTSHLLLAINILGAYELSKMLKPEAPSYQIYIHILLAIFPFLLFDLFEKQFNIWDLGVYISVITCIALITSLYSKFSAYSSISHWIALFYWGLSYSLAAHYVLYADVQINLIAIAIIILIWTSDTMAYFTGRKFGKRKLFESVSPKKTIEGSLGAGFSCLIIGILLGYFLNQSLLAWVVIALIIWVTGTYGDLVESKMKRSVNVKDSGTLLPGHGGFLDRFDSLVMIIPFLLLLTKFA